MGTLGFQRFGLNRTCCMEAFFIVVCFYILNQVSINLSVVSYPLVVRQNAMLRRRFALKLGTFFADNDTHLYFGMKVSRK